MAPITPLRLGFAIHIEENIAAHKMPTYPEIPKADASAIEVGKIARRHIAGKMTLDNFRKRKQASTTPYHKGLNSISQKARLCQAVSTCSPM